MKKLLQLKSSGISRGLFAAKSAARMIPSLLSRETDPRVLFRELIGSSINQFVDDVGELKGSILKAAQILSLYGEYYLPPEINEILKKVQSQGHFLGWEKVLPLIHPSILSAIEIETTPVAAASIGQVHRGKVIATGETVAVKIQYPGIRKAIDLDMRLIRTIFSMSRVLPKKINLDPIYREIRKVLIEEMDYVHEARKHAAYLELTKEIPGCSVPALYPEFCNAQVITSEFIDGIPLSSLPDLPQEERNRMGETLFRLFLHEIFRGNLIQTDSHPGNFLYRKGEIVLIDFGACLEYSERDLKNYRSLLIEMYRGNKESFLVSLDAITKDKGKYEVDRDLLWRYCELAGSPLRSESFDWGATTLPDELVPIATEMVMSASIETPPHEFIFLDRKVLGLFSLLRSLRANFNVKAIAEEYLRRS